MSNSITLWKAHILKITVLKWKRKFKNNFTKLIHLTTHNRMMSMRVQVRKLRGWYKIRWICWTFSQSNFQTILQEWLTCKLKVRLRINFQSSWKNPPKNICRILPKVFIKHQIKCGRLPKTEKINWISSSRFMKMMI